MKVLVTGGAGFIGSNIVDAFLAAGAEVLALDDLSTGKENNLTQASKSFGAKLKFERFDIRSPNLADVVAGFKPDLISHHAAQINVRTSVEKPVLDADINVVGTVNVCEAARLAGVPRIIFASTGGAIYGEQEVFPAPETHPARAESAYGVGKRGAELYLHYFAKTYKFSTVALRYGNVYGPRQNPKGEAGVVAIFTERFCAGKSLRVNGDGLQTRDFVYVGDVVAANMAATRVNKPGELTIYNVGRATETSVMDIVASLQRIVKSPAMAKYKLGELVIEHGPGLPGEQRRSVIDFSKIKSELGWTPKVDLDTGLQLTVESALSKQSC